MFDFIRLLHLSGLLLESDLLTPEQAIMIFKHLGATDDDLLPHNLKKTYVKLAKNHHPDLRGGDGTWMKYINASYDLLKAAASTSTTPQTGAQTNTSTSTPETGAQTNTSTSTPETGEQPERRRINCPHCKKQIVSSFIKCPWCGTRLKPQTGAQTNTSTSTTPETEAQPKQRLINCPHCKRQIINSFIKCPWCKTKLTPYS